MEALAQIMGTPEAVNVELAGPGTVVKLVRVQINEFT